MQTPLSDFGSKHFPICLWCIFTVLLAGLPTWAQESSNSTEVFAFEAYMERVRTHHPMARQAQIQAEKGDAAVLEARGAFDPKPFAEVAQKYYDDKQYYSQVDGGLKIPTWFGLELKGGYEQNQGVFLNPEQTVPTAGLLYAGVSLPLGQGLFIDERRAELKQARLYLQSTAAEQAAMLNDLLYQAGNAYWQWFEAYNVLKVYEEAVLLTEQRLNAVRQGAILGDRPAIDTLEAGIQFQNRQLNLREAELNYRNATARLGIYLWDEGYIPLEIGSDTRPPDMLNVAGTMVETGLLIQMDSLVYNHPLLRQYRLKVEQLEVDKRWKMEQLKPTLNLNYNAITEAVADNPLAEYSVNNYKWGLTFSIPILLRKERGALRLADLKIQETELDLNTKSATVAYKAMASLNEWETTADQVKLFTQTVRDYNGLLNGERQMFNAGESSLFMVNSRELGYINAQVKLVELLSKNHKAALAARYALGIL